MVTVSTVLLAVFVVTAAVTDLVWHKVYNWTTYPGIAAGLIVNLFEKGWEAQGGLEDSLKGFALCGLVMLVAYVFFSVGGGDVKLLAMMGAFLGVEAGLEALLWTFVLGGVAGLALLIWRVGAVRLIVATFRHLVWSLRLARWQPLSPEERQSLQPPLYLAPAAVAAVVIVRFQLVSLT
jgi:prepilin peptidase CpaA